MRTKENIDQSHTPPAQDGRGVSQGLVGVRRVAKEWKQEKFTTLRICCGPVSRLSNGTRLRASTARAGRNMKRGWKIGWPI